ncbi:MAG: two-component regulator propeller domain-containing protein [Saprospiraceae bacterium]
MQGLRHCYTSILLSCLFTVTTVQAQTDIRFEQLSGEQGFYQSIVYQLTQDRVGNIWAATEDGVVRFNGRESYSYNTYRGLPEGMPHRIEQILHDSAGRLWIAGANGIALYNPREDAFETVESSEDRYPTDVNTLLEDRNQQIWIGAFNGIWQYNTTSAKLQCYHATKETNVLLPLDADRLLVGTREGLGILHLPSKTYNPLPNLVNDEVKTLCLHNGQLFVGTRSSGIYKVSLDLQQATLVYRTSDRSPMMDMLPQKDGSMIVATDGAGLIWLNAQGQLQKRATNDVDAPHSISSNGIYDLLEDKDGILWVATYGGGINIINPYKNQFRQINHIINTRNSISHPFTRAMLEDDAGNIWFGTKAGISIWNRNAQTWQHIRQFNAGGNLVENPIIMALEEDGDYIWAGTYNFGTYRIRKTNFDATYYGPEAATDRRVNIDKVYAVHKDREGRIWLGGINALVHCLHTDGTVTTYPVQEVKHIRQLRDGTIAMSGRMGITLVDNATAAPIQALNPIINGLAYSTINGLCELNDGRLALATNGAGLLLFDRATDSIQIIDKEDGLPSDMVQSILRQNDSIIWLGTARGLARIPLGSAHPSITIYDKTDGLNSTEFNYGSYTKLSSGELMFGGVQGIVLFDPARIQQVASAPTIVFEEFRLFNRKVEPDEDITQGHINVINELHLRYAQNAFTIKFSGILQPAPGKVKYSWMLDGFNDTCSTPSTENQTNFTNIPPGNYVLRVKAMNRDGQWGEERRLPIFISPPWWNSPLAYLIYGVLGVGLLIAGFRLGSIIINKRNAEQQIAFFNNITHELKTPLTILLANLEQITGDAADDKRIRTTIRRLNSLFEQLLNFHKATADVAAPGHIKAFLPEPYIEKLLRSFSPLMEERHIQLEIISGWDDRHFHYNTEIFDKIIFNLVSNAVKYSKEGGRITVKMDTKGDEKMSLQVIDNGMGIPKDQQKYILKQYYRARNVVNSQLPGTGLGLMMVKNLVEKDQGSIGFNSIEGQGTTFEVILKDQIAQYDSKAAVADTTSLPLDDAQLDLFQDVTLLIVEDNDDLRQTLAERLQGYFQIETASNGKEGLEKAAEVFPDLIITDLIMPEMDGLTMARKLQDNIDFNHVPIIMLSVLQTPAQKLESLESGIAEYLEKPINFPLLLAKIANLLNWQRKMRQRYRNQVEMETAEQFRSSRDAEFIGQLENFVLQNIGNENLSVQELCKEASMSRTSLYMKLKNLIDMSPQDFIIHIRLKYARKLLTESGQQIKEVAYQCGFSNPKYFSTSFKKQFGQSPSEFLQKLGNTTGN